MKLIGLTGGIATGKSTVSKMLQDQGLAVIDADVLAREVVEAHSFGLEGIRSFVPEAVDEDGTLNRGKLREKIFSDPQIKKVVENTLHPLIHWRAQREFDVLRLKRTPIAFYDAALIFEKNLTPIFDEILVVRTDEATQISRLMKRDQLSEDQARNLLESQWPIEKKAALAHRIIDNGDSLEKTREQVLNLIRQYQS